MGLEVQDGLARLGEAFGTELIIRTRLARWRWNSQVELAAAAVAVKIALGIPLDSGSPRAA